MDPHLAEILATLRSAYGPEQGRTIFGSYRLAETAVILERKTKELKAKADKPTSDKPEPTPLRSEQKDETA